MRRLGFALLCLYLTAVILPLVVRFVAKRLPVPHAPGVAMSAQEQELAGFFALEIVGSNAPDEVEVAITALVREPAAACSMVIVYDPANVAVAEAALSGQPVAPADWIAPPMVRQDEVVAPGQINYSVEGTDGPLLAADEERTLGTITFHILTSEVPTVAIKSLYVRDTAYGTMLVDVLITPQHPLLLVASSSAVPTEVPAPSPTPPPTPTPTPVVVLPSPTPLPAPTATPQPPLTPEPALEPASMPVSGFYLRLLPGQTLYGVAHTFGVGVDRLMAVNGIVDPHSIPAETPIFVPLDPPSAFAPRAYFVAPYDRLGSIAEAMGIDAALLAAWNSDVLADGLQAGEWLRLQPPSR